VIVLLTVLFGALPAAGAILYHLNRQIESRMQNAQLATQALYDAERERMSTLILTFSERPTLCSLVKEGNTQALIPYLETLREGTPIDVIFLVIGDKKIAVPASSGLPDLATLRAGREPVFADFVVMEGFPNLLIASSSPIQSAGLCELDSPGWIMAIQILDDKYMHNLAQDTGMEQSLIINGHRAATSLPSAPDWSLNPKMAEVVRRSLTSCCTPGINEGQDYYVGLAPVIDNQGQLIAISELALPGNALIQAAWSAIALLLGVNLMIAIGSAYVGMSLARRITRPLSQLAEAAEHLTRGNLETPLPTESGWTEIDQLAGQLEISRRFLRQKLQIDQREMKHFTHLLSAIREGMVVINHEGFLTWLNPNTERILGYRAADVRHSHYSRVFRPAPGETLTLKEVLEPRSSQPTINRITILDAKDRPLTLAISASQVQAHEKSDGLQERVVTFQELNGETSYNRLRSEFLTNIAHEFRTPLSSIAASIELLEEEGPGLSPDELTELVHATRLSTQHLQTLVDNLLESAVIEAGCFQLRCHPIQVQDVIQKTAEMLTLLLKRRQQNLEIDAPQDLPSIWADPARLSQVLVNLIDNASKYSPFGTTITLSVQRQDGELRFAVLDRGPGLPAVSVRRLFERFATFTEMGGGPTGIGLGLPVVKAIVEAHGGQVGAENRSQGGAEIWFTLPVKSQWEE
jgi:PAS domain S-box-containing protein